MGRSSTSRYFSALNFIVFYFGTLSADPNSSFYFKNFDGGSKFESQLALYGDAKLINGGNSIQISGSSFSSAGRVMYKKPIRLVDGNPKKSVSFSTYFSFSMSPENGDGLAFVMVPIGFPLDVFGSGSFGLLTENKSRFLAVEFDTSKDEKYSDLNENHVGVDIDSLVSIKLRNLSSIDLKLNNGEKLQVWIDYQAGSKRLEVRITKFGDLRPIDPLISCPIDLSNMWKEEEFVIGLSSSSGNSLQRCDLYTWSFKQRVVPQWMHSQPLDPETIAEQKNEISVPKRSDCVLRILAAVILGTACGAFGALIVLFLWTFFGNRRKIVPESSVHPLDFEYKKFKVVVDEMVAGGNKQ